MRGIRIPIGADLGPLDRGLAQVKTRFAQMGQNLAATVGAAVAGAFSIRMFSGLMDEFDKIAKQAKRLDVAAPTLQRMGIAARLAGTDGETLTRVLISLNARLRDATDAGDGYRDTLAKLGLDAAKFVNLSPETQLAELARAYEATNDPAQYQADLIKLLGMRAQTVLPLIKQGYAALSESISGATTLTNEQFAAIEAANDAWTVFMNNAKTSLAGFLPLLDKVPDVLAGIATGLRIAADVYDPKNFNLGDLLSGKLARDAIFREATAGPNALRGTVLNPTQPDAGPISTLMADHETSADASAKAKAAAELARQLATINTLEGRLYDARRRVIESTMTERELLATREKQVEAMRESIAFQKEINAIESTNQLRQAILEDEIELQEKLLDIERLRARIENEKPPGATTSAALSGIGGAVSSLARVGGERGAGLRNGPELDLARQRTRRLDEIAATLRNIATNPGLTLA